MTSSNFQVGASYLCALGRGRLSGTFNKQFLAIYFLVLSQQLTGLQKAAIGNLWPPNAMLLSAQLITF